MSFSIFKNINGKKYEFEYSFLTIEEAESKKKEYFQIGLEAKIIKSGNKTCTLYDVYVKQ